MKRRALDWSGNKIHIPRPMNSLLPSLLSSTFPFNMASVARLVSSNSRSVSRTCLRSFSSSSRYNFATETQPPAPHQTAANTKRPLNKVFKIYRWVGLERVYVGKLLLMGIRCRIRMNQRRSQHYRLMMSI